MKNWMNRFAVLAVLGSVVCGAFIAGCGSKDEEGTPATNNATNKPKDGDEPQ